MVLDIAKGIHTTGAFQETWISALTTDAGLCAGTLGTGLTSRLADTPVTVHVNRTVRFLGGAGDRLSNAAGIGVPFEAVTADASAFVLFGQAISIGSATETGARVLAFGLTALLSANCRLWTVLID